MPDVNSDTHIKNKNKQNKTKLHGRKARPIAVSQGWCHSVRAARGQCLANCQAFGQMERGGGWKWQK